jgi:hypothetical protein
VVVHYYTGLKSKARQDPDVYMLERSHTQKSIKIIVSRVRRLGVRSNVRPAFVSLARTRNFARKTIDRE